MRRQNAVCSFQGAWAKRAGILAWGDGSLIISRASWLGWQNRKERSILHKNPKHPKNQEVISCSDLVSDSDTGRKPDDLQNWITSGPIVTRESRKNKLGSSTTPTLLNRFFTDDNPPLRQALAASLADSARESPLLASVLIPELQKYLPESLNTIDPGDRLYEAAWLYATLNTSDALSGVGHMRLCWLIRF